MEIFGNDLKCVVVIDLMSDTGSLLFLENYPLVENRDISWQLQLIA